MPARAVTFPTRSRPHSKGRRLPGSDIVARAEFIPPMKALGVTEPPAGVWRCEIKFDGYRALALCNDGTVELWSRNRKPMTDSYPELIPPLAKLHCRSAVLDGEIVALDTVGHSHFQLLQAREMSAERPPIVYYVFDLLHLDGASLLDTPIEERRRLMERFIGKAHPPLQLSPVFVVEPAELMKEVTRQGLEGLVAKRPGSRYEPDRRSGAWVKCKIVNEQEFVIGGFTPPRNSREFFGAILVGYYSGNKLLYAGKVGSGFDRARLRALHGEFLRRRRTECPFSNLPMERRPRFGRGMTRSEMRSVTWVEPELVAQIRFGEWTADGLLRQPVFVGLRTDKSAREVRREATRSQPPT